MKNDVEAYWVIIPAQKNDPITTVRLMAFEDVKTKEEDALWAYNLYRKNNGLAVVDALPAGTVFTKYEPRL